MLVRKRCRGKEKYSLSDENERDFSKTDSGFSSYLEKSVHGTENEQETDVDDYEVRNTTKEPVEFSFLSKLLSEKERQKKMLQTLGGKGLGKRNMGEE